MQKWQHRLITVLILPALLLVMAPPSGYAGGDPQPRPQAEAPDPLQRDFKPPLGTYTYNVTWEGGEVGRIHVNVSRQGDHFQVRTEAKARSFINRLYKVNYLGIETYSAEDWQPVEHVVESRFGKKSSKTEIRYRDDKTVEVAETSAKKGEAPTSKKQDMTFEEFMVDPFTAVSLATLVNWEKDMTQVFRVFEGDDTLQVELHAADRQSVQIAGQERDAWIIVPKIENMTRPEKSPKIEETFIMISADEKRDVLKVETTVSAGQVSIELVEFTPQP